MASDEDSNTAVPKHRFVIQTTIGTIIDNLNVDSTLLEELKRRRVINDRMLVDVLSRPNRPQKALCLSNHLLGLGPHALRETCSAMAKCGHKAIAAVLQRLLKEKRDRSRSRARSLSRKRSYGRNKSFSKRQSTFK